MKLLFLYTPDYKFLTTAKKPVRNQEDVKGLKIREVGGISSDPWGKLGATPMLIPMPGVYKAVWRGVIDGLTTP